MSTAITIPAFDLKQEVLDQWNDFLPDVEAALKSGQFIQGPNVKNFEKEVANFLKVKYAVTVNSGTDALVIGLRALGIEPGDEVITSSFSFFATAEAISLIGAVPKFADVNLYDYNLNPTEVEKNITAKTKAILPVHIFGQAAPLSEISEIAAAKKLKVLEDVAQAFAGKYHSKYLGTLGNAGAFSFFPTKNLGAFGDGGMLTTNDDAVAEKAKWLREHGAPQRYHHEMFGYTSRLDELQAVFLRHRLRSLPEKNEKRRKIARFYEERLHGISELLTPQENPITFHVYHQYTLRVLNGKRDELQKALLEEGIGSSIYYSTPIHLQKPYVPLEVRLPNTEKLAKEVLSLPMWPNLSDDQLEKITTTVKRFF